LAKERELKWVKEAQEEMEEEVKETAEAEETEAAEETSESEENTADEAAEEVLEEPAEEADGKLQEAGMQSGVYLCGHHEYGESAFAESGKAYTGRGGEDAERGAGESP